MKMKKVLSSLTAGAIAATTMLTAGLASSITSFTVSASDYYTMAYLSLYNSLYYAENGTYWDELITIDSATIDGVSLSSTYTSSDADAGGNQYALVYNFSGVAVSTLTDGGLTSMTEDSVIAITFTLSTSLSSAIEIGINMQAYDSSGATSSDWDNTNGTITIQDAGTYTIYYTIDDGVSDTDPSNGSTTSSTDETDSTTEADTTTETDSTTEATTTEATSSDVTITPTLSTEEGDGGYYYYCYTIDPGSDTTVTVDYTST